MKMKVEKWNRVRNENEKVETDQMEIKIDTGKKNWNQNKKNKIEILKLKSK